MARNTATIKKNAGRGCSLASGIVATTTSIFTVDSAPVWRSIQRAHTARAAAFLGRGVELRRLIRARARQ